MLLLTNYYVKNGGNDSADGLSDANAWETIDKVIGFGSFIAGDIVSFNKGDTFVCSGSISDQTKALRSPIDDLTFNAYGAGNRPIISGNGKSSAFRMTDSYEKDDITIDGLQFQDGRTVSGVIGSTAYENGYTFAYWGDGLTLTDCVFDGASSFENCIVGKSTGAITYTIQNCQFKNTQMRAGLYLVGVTGALVEDCRFYDNIGYDTYETKYEGSGLKVNHGGVDQIFRRNWFENNHKGFNIASATNSIFYNNVVIGETTVVENGFCIGLNNPDDGNKITALKIYYNTVILKDCDNQAFAVYVDGDGVNPDGWDFRNNIVWADGLGTSVDYLIQIGTGEKAPTFMDYNLWWTPAGGSVRWFHGGITSSPYAFVANWQTEGSYDPNGVNDDPDFADYNYNEFDLITGSPAISAGTPLVDLDSNPILLDYNGNARDAVNPDMGAYEYSPNTYYIDYLTGDDSNDGLSSSQAWKTWYPISGSRMATNIVNNATVLFKRGQTYKRSHVVAEHPTVEGNGCWRPSNRDGITFGAYGSGDKPIIDLDSSTSGDKSYCGYNGALTNTTFQYLNFINSVGRNDLAGNLMTAHESCNHLTFSYCDFDATNESGLGSSTTKNETFSMACDQTIVDNCTALGASPYNRHAFYVDGYQCEFTNNYVKGFGVSGLKFNGSSMANSIMSHNVIIDAGVGIDLGHSDSCDIFSNVIIQTANYTTGNPKAIQLESNSAVGEEPHNNKIFNNTIVCNADSGLLRTMRMYKNDGSWDLDEDNEYANNIIMFYNALDGYFVHMGSDFTTPVPSNNNLYSSDGVTYWYNGVSTYSSLSAWRLVTNAPTDFEQSSLVGDPDFDSHSVDEEDPVSYRIGPSSDAIGAGKIVTPNNILWANVTDYDGNSFATNDIGAFAYLPVAGGYNMII